MNHFKSEKLFICKYELFESLYMRYGYLSHKKKERKENENLRNLRDPALEYSLQQTPFRRKYA